MPQPENVQPELLAGKAVLILLASYSVSIAAALCIDNPIGSIWAMTPFQTSHMCSKYCIIDNHEPCLRVGHPYLDHHFFTCGYY